MAKNVLLILSLLANGVMAVILVSHSNKTSNEKQAIQEINEAAEKQDFEITSANNFEAVFVNRNDSIYNRLWYDNFQNHPETAFLMSCAYFVSTQNEKALKDIKTSISQLEDIYRNKIAIQDSLITR